MSGPTSPRSTVRARLREATRREHDAVDALFSRFDLADAAGYAAFLALQAAAHAPVEAALDRAGAAAVLDDWPARRRAHLLLADLADLGADARPPVPAPAFDTAPALLGGLYVLEGSRLGGAVLRRRLPAAAPARFLAAAAPQGSWGRLLALLETKLHRQADLAEAVAAARAVFRCFERAGTADLETSVGR
jgi:heme oxygenase